MQDRTHMISLGQGQGVIAEAMLAKSIQKGDWLFLQNCHLAASWMPRLEVLVKEFSEQQDLNPSFRLFLSSMPSTIFPTSILQESVKVTNEPPKGLRANLAKSFADISRDMYDDSPPQGVKFKKLLFGLVFFNAVIQVHFSLSQFRNGLIFRNAKSLDRLAGISCMTGAIQIWKCQSASCVTC